MLLTANSFASVVRLLCSLVLALTVGCQAARVPAKTVCREVLDDYVSAGVFHAAVDSKNYETGGVIVEEGGEYRVVVVPNEYMKLLEYIAEFERQDYSSRAKFFTLVRHARKIHAHNNSAGLVRQIDMVLVQEDSASFATPIVDLMRSVSQCAILPHTYRAWPMPKNAVLWWHTHPNGGGPSPFDLDNGSRFAVVYVADSLLKVHVVDAGRQTILYQEKPVDPTDTNIIASSR